MDVDGGYFFIFRLLALAPRNLAICHTLFFFTEYTAYCHGPGMVSLCVLARIVVIPKNTKSNLSFYAQSLTKHNKFYGRGMCRRSTACSIALSMLLGVTSYGLPAASRPRLRRSAELRLAPRPRLSAPRPAARAATAAQTVQTPKDIAGLAEQHPASI